MKKIVKIQPETGFILVEKLGTQPLKHIGFKQGNNKGILRKVDYFSTRSKIEIISADETSLGNSWQITAFDMKGKLTLVEAIEKVIESGCEVFIFNSSKEFFYWLAE